MINCPLAAPNKYKDIKNYYGDFDNDELLENQSWF